MARILAGPISGALNRDQGVSAMTERALSALVLAWTTTLIAASLLVAALALARVWDSAIYLQGLQGVFNLDV